MTTEKWITYTDGHQTIRIREKDIKFIVGDEKYLFIHTFLKDKTGQEIELSLEETELPTHKILKNAKIEETPLYEAMNENND